MTTNRKQSEQAKEHIYRYIQDLASNALPEQAVEDLYGLLWNRIAVNHNDVRQALTVVITADSFSQEEGLQFINRCFYSICNPWHLDTRKRAHLEQLVGRLSDLPEPEATNPVTAKLRDRIQTFNRGDYGDCLRRQMRLGGYAGYDPRHRQHLGLVGDILPDHFCLYRSATRTRDIEELESATCNHPWQSGIGAKQLVRLGQSHRQLKQYWVQRRRGAPDIHNPTRLPVAELDQCLTHYHPNRQDGLHLRAKHLWGQMQPSRRYGTVQPVVRDYLIRSIEPLPTGVRNKLTREFFDGLTTIEQQAAMVMGNVINLFSRLLDGIFLPTENTSSIIRLQRCLDRAGPMAMTSVLLSIVLACPMVRFSLERKLGYLYRSFEKDRLEDRPWVVTFFEHINLALVMNAEPLRYFPAVTRTEK
jgi:hypothetical protein